MTSARELHIAGLVAVTVLAGLTGLAGCDLAGPGSGETDSGYVVEAYLVAERSLPPVRLSRTAGIEEVYRPTERGVSDARVAIARLGPDGTPATRHSYRSDPDEPGRFLPEDSARVEPLATYRLEAEVPGREELIRARTLVPDTFRVLDANRDTVVYRGAEQLEVRLSPSRYPGRQSVYVITSVALDARVEQFTPFAREFSDADSAAVAENRVGSSPLLNEDNYTAVPGGELTVRMPWLAISFFGPNRLITRAVDDNLRDFLRSHAAQSGQTTLSPGEIPSIIDHVDGGRGIFGSYARADVEAFVARPPG